MNKHWNSKIVIAGMAVALGLPLVTPPAAFGEPRSTARDRRNDDEEPKIVREARVVEEGRNEELETTAKDDGQVWLYDATNKEVLHSMSIRKGNTYGINPKHDYVIVNGKEGERVKLDKSNTYRIYYVSEEDRDKKHSSDRDNTRDKSDRRVERDSARVPDSATLMAEGKDEELTVKATERGTLYLWDNSNKKVIETFNVSDGDRLTVSPRNNVMSVNGKTISRDIALDRHVGYKIMFDKRD